MVETLAGVTFFSGLEAADSRPLPNQRMNKTGLELVAEERQRQIEVEGFTPGHDAQYKRGELAGAAACYATAACEQHNGYVQTPDPSLWPWTRREWKPDENDPLPNLVKAAALTVAAIDLILQRRAEGIGF